MDAQALVDQLNHLLAMEQRGLVAHLQIARPHLTRANYRHWPRLVAMSRAAEDRAAELVDMIEMLHASPAAATFQTDVAHWHYTAFDVLLPHLIREQASRLAAYERAIGLAASARDFAADLRELRDEVAEQLDDLRAMGETTPS